MKYHVTIKNEEYQTFEVDAADEQEANKLVDEAMFSGALWEDEEKFKPYTQGSGDFWEVEPSLTEEA